MNNMATQAISSRRNRIIMHLACILCILCVCFSATSAYARGKNTTYINQFRLNQEMERLAEAYGFDFFDPTYSFGLCYLPTGDEYYYNPDIWMFPADLYKVPVSMMLEINNGGIEGKQYTVDEYLKENGLLLEPTDEEGVYKYAINGFDNKISEELKALTDLPSEYFETEFVDNGFFTARYITNVFKTLYNDIERYPKTSKQLSEQIVFNKEAYDRLPANYSLEYLLTLAENDKGEILDHGAGIIYTQSPVVFTLMSCGSEVTGDMMKELSDYVVHYSNTVSRAEADSLMSRVKVSADLGKDFYLGFAD